MTLIKERMYRWQNNQNLRDKKILKIRKHSQYKNRNKNKNYFDYNFYEITARNIGKGLQIFNKYITKNNPVT